MPTERSHACCTVPAVAHEGYEPKGQYETIEGLKTYTTGSGSAKTGVLVIFDIFGFYPQTLQGADIIATGDKEHQYQVFIPDWFEGKPVDINDYPPDNKEKEARLGKFFETAGAPPRTLERLPKVLKALEAAHPNVQRWGVVGYCWGGKVVNLASQSGSAFKAAVACHPAFVDAKDAPGVSIPYMLLASKDEDKDDVEKWRNAVKTENRVEYFPDQIHGWMAARKPEVKKEYERGYKLVLDFFHDHLSANVMTVCIG